MHPPCPQTSLGCGPAGQHEGNLVHEVGQVVHHIQESLVHCAQKVAEIVAQWINGPAHGLTALTSHTSCLAEEDLEKDEEPAEHAQTKAVPRVHCAALTSIPEEQHQDSADQKPPEHAATDWLARSLQDQVELDHLQW